MTLRKKLYSIVGIALVLAVVSAVFNILYLHKTFLNRDAKAMCSASEREFLRLMDLHSSIADSLSSALVRDRRLADLIAEDRREEILSLLKPIYDEFKKKGFIREMTVYKIPAKLVVNVGKGKILEKDVSHTRPDVVKSGKKCLKVKAILICKNYVGIRATNPVQKDEDVVGVISVGIDMRSFIAHYEDMTGKRAGVALRKDVLKEYLSNKSYHKYLTSYTQNDKMIFFSTDGIPTPLMNSGNIVGKVSRFSRGGEDYVICTVPIELGKNGKIGYFFTYAPLTYMSLNGVFKSVTIFLLIYLPTAAIVIGLLSVFAKNLTDRVRSVLHMVKMLQEKDFEYVEKIHIDPDRDEDEIDMLEREVVDLGKDMKRYIDRLSKEVRDYTGKAYMDSLTGLFNRRAFDEYGIELIEKFSIVGKPLAVLTIDVDNFKDINDTYGHSIGDIVLKSIAGSIRKSIRDSDVAFRYGGEEFVVLLPGAGERGSMKVAEKIRSSIERTPVETEAGTLKVTVSIGVTLVRKGERDPSEILKRSDIALYKAKKEGKNRVVFVP